MQLKLWNTGCSISMLLHFSDFLFRHSNYWRVPEQSFLGRWEERILHGWMLTSQVPGKTMSMVVVTVISSADLLQFWVHKGLFFCQCLSVGQLLFYCSAVLYYATVFWLTHACFLDSLRFTASGMDKH